MARAGRIRRPAPKEASAHTFCSTKIRLVGTAVAVAAALVAWIAQRRQSASNAQSASLLLGHAARKQRWDEALDLVQSRGANAYNGILTLTMTVRSLASIHGETSLSGICSGHCTAMDEAEPSFEQWLRWLSKQRYDGWQVDAKGGLFAAVRARDLRALEILVAAWRPERASMATALREPLLQLASTTRAEVIALCRILLSDRSHVRRQRLLSFLRGQGTAAAARLVETAEAQTGALAVEQAPARQVIDAWSAKFVTLLLRLGLDPTLPDACCGENALHVAALYGNLDAVEALMDTAVTTGATRRAARSGSADALLLRSRSRAGLTPLGLAAVRGRRGVACWLHNRSDAEGGEDASVQVPEEYRWALGERPCATDEEEPLPSSPPSSSRAAPPSKPPPVDAAWGAGSLAQPLAAVVEQPCGHRSHVPEVTSLDPSSFFARYYSLGRPVLLRRAAEKWPVRQAWSRQRLLTQHGRSRITPASVPYASSFGLPQAEAVPLRTFVEALFDPEGSSEGGDAGKASGRATAGHLYLFERSQNSEGGATTTPDAVGALLRAGRLPPMPPQLDLRAQQSLYQPQPPQLYLGGAGTGAPLHFHGDAFNVLVHGRKQWWIFPPDVRWVALNHAAGVRVSAHSPRWWLARARRWATIRCFRRVSG